MRRYFFVLMVLVASALARDAVQWNETSTGGVLTLANRDYQLLATATDAGMLSVLSMPGAGVSADVGDPAVPVYRRLIEVPFGADVTARVDVGATVEHALAYPLIPVQPPVPKSGPRPAFALNVKTYSADRQSSAIGAEVVDIVEMRGHRLAVVEICPVSYSPGRGFVEVAEQMTVRLTWTGADWGRTNQMHRRYSSPAFAGRLDGVVLGSERFAADAGPALPIGYLIIVPDAWQANIQPLAEWRHRKGFDVFVRNLSEVGGNSSTVIKNYIQNAYDNWPIPPSFVLLVGDVDRVGYFVGQGSDSPATDLNYAMVEGTDFLPDIDVSRASLVSSAQVDSFVARVVGYEQNTLTGGTTWLGKQFFIASADGGNHQIAENTHRHVMAKIRALGVVCDSNWMYYNSGTPIVAAINSGRSWVTYSGHGGETEWAEPTPTFDNAAVHALTNTDMIPYVQTYACLTGSFASTSYPECFSEAWIRNGRRGALAHMASSVTSYWTEDDTLERRVFDCMYDSSFTWIMGGFNKAKIWFYQQMGSGGSTRRYFEMYNLMGDGAIDVYSLEPRSIVVSYPPVIPVGAYPLSIGVTASGSPVPGALVCAMAKSDSTVYATGYTDAGGAVTLNITTLMPDSVYITVTGHNLAPHLGATMALPSSGPYIMYLRHTIDDAAGNGDGIINPGEAINLPTWLRNWGDAAAQSVSAKLSTSDPNITLTDSVKSFGTIAAGDSAYSGSSGYGFTVAPSCSNGYALRLALRCTDANDSVWTSPITLVVGAPELGYVSNVADDPAPGGNGNGMIDPGEDGDLIVTLRNTGMGNAYAVTATLRSGDARLVVLDSLGSFGDIARDSTGSSSSDRFRVHADLSIPRETQMPCTLMVAAGGIMTTIPFALDIGVIRSMDPIPDGPRTPARYYAYDVSDVLYSEAPVFSWVEIRGVGTELTLGDDETQVVTLPAGFGPWTYYGQNTNQVSICGNGWIAPGSTSSSVYSNVVLPDGAAPGIVAVCWDDLYPPAGNGVWYYHDAANHRFIVEWDSMPYYSARSVQDWFQVIIYDTTVHTETGDNVVLAQYLTANGYSSVTVGMEDQASTIGINCLTDGSYHRGAAPITAGMAIKYTTNPPRPRTGIIEDGGAASLPTRLALLGNWPNPFRTATVLTYAVPRSMNVSLGIYDAAGRRVTELVNRTVEPGTHAARWDGLDSRGRRAARGVYFYRLDGEKTSLVRKAVLVE